MTNKLNQTSWDTISKAYQRERTISLTDVHYGPVAPGEKELGLLGDVKGKKVLELGCGGGQNAIVLAKWGAEVVGLDLSAAQLGHATELAEREGVFPKFVQGNMEDLSQFQNNAFDIALSSHALGYVEDLNAVYRETTRVLKPGGFLVFCFEHPFWLSFGVALEEQDLGKVRNYFDRTRDSWNWDCSNGTTTNFEQGNWTFREVINGLINVGLQIERIEEPQGYDPAQMDENTIAKIPYLSYDDKREFIETIRQIPFSLIVKARKPS
ncbi:MAG: class I SAM-dependent methyltransferase [Candidatus Hodarchaeales archaeon]|jgi:ubiquinone/menaquinone biosynthesis C-methylase UbiE